MWVPLPSHVDSRDQMLHFQWYLIPIPSHVCQMLLTQILFSHEHVGDGFFTSTLQTRPPWQCQSHVRDERGAPPSRRWISNIFVDIYCVSDGRKEKTWFSKNALFAESAGENTKSVTQRLPGRIGARSKPHLLHFKFSLGFHICCRKATKQAVSFLYFEHIGHCYASYYIGLKTDVIKFIQQAF